MKTVDQILASLEIKLQFQVHVRINSESIHPDVPRDRHPV